MFHTIQYRGHYIQLDTKGNVETIRVCYIRPDGSNKRGPTFYTVHGAKLWITRRINAQHQEALLIDALRDIAAGRWTAYNGANLAERTTIHYAHIRASNARS